VKVDILHLHGMVEHCFCTSESVPSAAFRSHLAKRGNEGTFVATGSGIANGFPKFRASKNSRAADREQVRLERR